MSVRAVYDCMIFLQAAASGATFIVSWDKHLLSLMNGKSTEGADFQARFPSIRVVDPVEFVAAVGKRL